MATQSDWPARLTRSIAAEIRKHRTVRGMSAQQLADRCTELGADLPRSTLADLENGRRASLTIAELLVVARALDVPPLLLVFPVNTQTETEVLPDERRPTWRSLQWASGEAPFPGPDDADLLTVLTSGNCGNAAPLVLYRAHDQAAADEIRAATRARDYERMAAAAGTEAEREAFKVAAAAQLGSAEDAADAAERMRSDAAGNGWPSPQPIMRLIVPESHS